ncbi:MAG: hypothetical protein KGL39_43785 [Patescibacteria group bacterium]|nr:hypothetical protein [Patescibacteria group bacterium]
MTKAALNKQVTMDKSNAKPRSLQRGVKPLGWKWSGHLSGNRCVTAYRDERYGAQMEVWCNRRGFYPLVEYYGGGTSYFLDGDKREYKSEAALKRAIVKRLNAESSQAASGVRPANAELKGE